MIELLGTIGVCVIFLGIAVFFTALQRIKSLEYQVAELSAKKMSEITVTFEHIELLQSKIDEIRGTLDTNDLADLANLSELSAENLEMEAAIHEIKEDVTQMQKHLKTLAQLWLNGV